MSRLFTKLESLTHSESESERKIAAQLLKMDASLADTSAIALGKLCGVSNASIVRFSQNLGYKGYTALKLDFLAGRKSLPGLNPDSWLSDEVSSENRLRKAGHHLTESLDHSLQYLDIAQLEKAAERVVSSNRVAVISQGASSLAATYIAQSLTQNGRSVLFQQDRHIQKSYAAQLREDDMAVALCVSGDSEEVISAMHQARDKGCFILAITGDASSTVSELADIVLSYSYNEETLHALGSGPLISMLAILDLLLHSVTLSGDHNEDQQTPVHNKEWISFLIR